MRGRQGNPSAPHIRWLSDGEEVRPVVCTSTKLHVVPGDVVGIDRAQAGIVPSVYRRKPAIRQSNSRAFGSKLPNLRESAHPTIQPKGASLLDDLIEIAGALRVPLPGVVGNANTACAAAEDELGKEPRIS